jgi:hypothetical protein
VVTVGLWAVVVLLMGAISLAAVLLETGRRHVAGVRLERVLRGVPRTTRR